MSSSRVRVYIASSLDGFIAGPNDELDWLPQPGSEELKATSSDAIEFDDFIGDIGVLLMGRRTYDVVLGLGHELPYGSRPILVATNRALPEGAPNAEAVSGSIEELVAKAKARAGDRDVYIDGGLLIRQALDAGLVDDMVITFAPSILGSGIPLFAGALRPQGLEFLGHHQYGSMIQIHARPLR